LEHYPMTDVNGAPYLGGALNTQQIDALKLLLQYAIECALPEGDSVNLQFPLSSGIQTITFYGSRRLAPMWKTQGLDTAGQELVSACLMARTNALGVKVRISLRARPEMPAAADEAAAYNYHEGAFMGNLFGSTPVAKVCAGTADGNGWLWDP